MLNFVGLVLVALITSGVGYLSYRASNRVRTVEAAVAAAQLKTDAALAAEAVRVKAETDRLAVFESAQRATADMFERAQRVNNEIVDGLREEITRLRAEVATLRSAYEEASQRDIEKERAVAAMERSLTRMQDLVRQYVTQLRAAGITVPEDDEEII